MRFEVEGFGFRDSGLPAFWLQFLPMREVSEQWPCSLLLVEVLFWEYFKNYGDFSGAYSGGIQRNGKENGKYHHDGEPNGRENGTRDASCGRFLG